MKTKLRSKMLILGLIMAVFASVAFGLGFSPSNNAYASDSGNFDGSRTETISYYIGDGNATSVTDNLDTFLASVSSDVSIQVVYELQYETEFRNEISEILDIFATKAEVDRALAQNRESSRAFHTSRNAAFLSEQNFSENSDAYRTTVSHYSPHIIMTFDNKAAFETYSQSIESSCASMSVQRISVHKFIEYEDEATRVNANNA